MWSLDYNQVKIDSSHQSPAVMGKNDDKQSTPCGSRQSESDSKFFPESFSPPPEISGQGNQRLSMYSSMQSESGVTSPTILDRKPTFFNPSSHSESDDGGELSNNSENNQSQTTMAVTPATGADLEDFVFIESNQIAADRYENKAILKPGSLFNYFSIFLDIFYIFQKNCFSWLDIIGKVLVIFALRVELIIQSQLHFIV